MPSQNCGKQEKKITDLVQGVIQERTAFGDLIPDPCQEAVQAVDHGKQEHEKGCPEEKAMIEFCQINKHSSSEDKEKT